MAEWTFLQSSFTTLSSTPGVATGSEATYTWEGIAFDTQYSSTMANVNFRDAIAALTDYAGVEGNGGLPTVLSSGFAGTAEPYILPSPQYAFINGKEPSNAPSFSLAQAVTDLCAAGIYAYEGGSIVTPCSSLASQCTSTACTFTGTVVWCTTNSGGSCASADVFSPTITYRNDDPLRDDAAALLIADAGMVGLTILGTGVTGTEAGTAVYGEASAMCTPGTYNPSDGLNDNPSAAPLASFLSNTPGAYQMYTFGWIVSANFEAQGIFWNSQFCGTSDNFGGYINSTVDFWSNQILYATTVGSLVATPSYSACSGVTLATLSTCEAGIGTGAEAAAWALAFVTDQQQPYVTWYWENSAWGSYIQGWAGYTSVYTTGPNTGLGIYWTELGLNDGNQQGGTASYAIHQAADPSGLNPLYNTEWVWQADVWGSIYDSPLAVEPDGSTTPLQYSNYMTQTFTTGTFGGAVPSGSFCYTTGKSCKSSGLAYAGGNSITGGEEVVYYFLTNMTWSDNVPFSALDMQYSLFYWDGQPSALQPDALTTDTCGYCGPAGLLASKIGTLTSSQVINSVTLPKGTQYIEMYFGSDNIWNIGSVDVPVLPAHVLTYYSPDKVATADITSDFTQPYATQDIYGIAGVPTPPNYMYYLPNTEVGSGPFELTAFSATTGAGVLTANPNYYHSAWWDSIGNNTGENIVRNTVSGAAINDSADPINMTTYIFNPSQVNNYCGVAPFSDGLCDIVGPAVPGESSVATSGVLNLYLCTGAPSGGTIGDEVGPTSCSEVLNTLTSKPAVFSLTQYSYNAVSGACPSGGFKSGTKCYTSKYTFDITLSVYNSATHQSLTSLPVGYYEIVDNSAYSFQSLARVWYQAQGFEVTS